MSEEVPAFIKELGRLVLEETPDIECIAKAMLVQNTVTSKLVGGRTVDLEKLRALVDKGEFVLHFFSDHAPVQEEWQVMLDYGAGQLATLLAKYPETFETPDEFSSRLRRALCELPEEVLLKLRFKEMAQFEAADGESAQFFAWAYKKYPVLTSKLASEFEWCGLWKKFIDEDTIAGVSELCSIATALKTIAQLFHTEKIFSKYLTIVFRDFAYREWDGQDKKRYVSVVPASYLEEAVCCGIAPPTFLLYAKDLFANKENLERRVKKLLGFPELHSALHSNPITWVLAQKHDPLKTIPIPDFAERSWGYIGNHAHTLEEMQKLVLELVTLPNWEKTLREWVASQGSKVQLNGPVPAGGWLPIIPVIFDSPHVERLWKTRSLCVYHEHWNEDDTIRQIRRRKNADPALVAKYAYTKRVTVQYMETVADYDMVDSLKGRTLTRFVDYKILVPVAKLPSPTHVSVKTLVRWLRLARQGCSKSAFIETVLLLAHRGYPVDMVTKHFKLERIAKVLLLLKTSN